MPPAEPRCGYCAGRLVWRGRGGWGCRRCDPLLDQVHTPEEYERFKADAEVARGRRT